MNENMKIKFRNVMRCVRIEVAFFVELLTRYFYSLLAGIFYSLIVTHCSFTCYFVIVTRCFITHYSLLVYPLLILIFWMLSLMMDILFKATELQT